MLRSKRNANIRKMIILRNIRYFFKMSGIEFVGELSNFECALRKKPIRISKQFFFKICLDFG